MAIANKLVLWGCYFALVSAAGGCGSKTEAEYRKAQEAVAEEESRLDALRGDVQRAVKGMDEHRQFVALMSQLNADHERASFIELKMEKPFTAEYLAARAAAEGDRKKLFQMIYSTRKDLGALGEEYKAAEAAVKAQEQKVLDAVALRNKLASETQTASNEPIVVEARRLHEAAAIYDRMAVPLSGSELAEAMRKQGFELQEVKDRHLVNYTMFDRLVEIRSYGNLGKTRNIRVFVNTNHTDAAKRQRSMDLSYAIGAKLLNLPEHEAKRIIGKAVSDAATLGSGESTKRIYGFDSGTVTLHARADENGYRLDFLPSLLTR